MTVREAVKVLTEAKTLYISWHDNLRVFDPDDELMMDAYGDYKVSRICTTCDSSDESYEIAIDATPIKAVTA